MTSTSMPFGKYRGSPLRDVPNNYLRWVVMIAQEPLRSAVELELATRRDPTSPDPVLVTVIINSGFRQLALQHHPDQGGDLKTMQTLNSTVTWLRRQVQGVLA